VAGQVGCTFMIDGTGGYIVGDVAVYLGDLEVCVCMCVCVCVRVCVCVCVSE